MSYVHLEMVLDRSGSMQDIASDMIGGVNQLLSDQRKVSGDMTISLRQFDNIYETVYEMRGIKEAPDLSSDTFIPRGATALWDAIGRTIVSLDAQLAAMKAQPDHVIFVIVTDGIENASKEFTLATILELITGRRQKGWLFTFLGAGEDAIATAGQMNIPASASMNYAKTAGGVRGMSVSASVNLTQVRSGTSSTMDWNPAQRQEQEKELQKGVWTDHDK